MNAMNDQPANLEQLYRTAGPAVWTFIRRRTPDVATAEEVFQDAFLAAAKRPDVLAAARSQRAWLFGIARNLLRGLTRRRSPQLMASLDELPGGKTRDAQGPIEEMRRAMNRLPAAQREVLELRLAQELSYEEIAEVLGIPIGTVRSRLHNAVAGLRTWAKDVALR
jgi:RNA polymerase sigma-70 factor (ECF subfamily)